MFSRSDGEFFGGDCRWNRTCKRRGILPTGTNTNCIFCEEMEESLDHLLFNCSFSHQVWTLCYSWLDVCTVLPGQSWAHFLQHGSDFRTVKQQGGAKAVWMAVAWSLWLHRNSILFKNGQRDALRVVEAAQMRSRSWLRARNRDFQASTYDWITNPRLCLGYL